MSLTSYVPPAIETIDPGDITTSPTAMLPIVIAIAAISWGVAIYRIHRASGEANTPMADDELRVVTLPGIDADDGGTGGTKRAA